MTRGRAGQTFPAGAFAGAALFAGAFFRAAAFFAGALRTAFVAGPRVRRSASSSTARSWSISSTESPRRSDALVSPSVT